MRQSIDSPNQLTDCSRTYPDIMSHNKTGGSVSKKPHLTCFKHFQSPIDQKEHIDSGYISDDYRYKVSSNEENLTAIHQIPNQNHGMMITMSRINEAVGSILEYPMLSPFKRKRIHAPQRSRTDLIPCDKKNQSEEDDPDSYFDNIINSRRCKRSSKPEHIGLLSENRPLSSIDRSSGLINIDNAPNNFLNKSQETTKPNTVSAEKQAVIKKSKSNLLDEEKGDKGDQYSTDIFKLITSAHSEDAEIKINLDTAVGGACKNGNSTIMRQCDSKSLKNVENVDINEREVSVGKYYSHVTAWNQRSQQCLQDKFQFAICCTQSFVQSLLATQLAENSDLVRSVQMLNYLKKVLGKYMRCINEANLKHSDISRDRKLYFLSLRLFAVTYLMIYQNQGKDLCHVMSVPQYYGDIVKSAKKNMDTTRGPSLENGTFLTITEKQNDKIHRFLNIMKFIRLAHSYWEEAYNYVTKKEAFYLQLDTIGCSLELTSSVQSVANHVQAGLDILKESGS